MYSDFISRHRLLWLVLVALVGIGADQASKYWAQNTLAMRFDLPAEGTEQQEDPRMVTRYFPAHTIVVIPNAFDLVYKENPAAAFSLTSSLPDWFRRPFLILVSSLATIFFLVWYFRMKNPGALMLTSFCLIMAGAIGNFLDRVRFGYVIDFLDVYAGFLGFQNAHWPTFNVADSCIVVGAIGVIFRTLRPMPNQEM